jgi:cytochrome o ubiquinol oxidase subunit 1
MKELLVGKLTAQALPHEWFTIGGTVAFGALGLFAIIVITRLKRWKWLWNEWLTSVDPKKIGIMYFLVAGFMLLRGGLDAIMIWLQQALSPSVGVMGSEHGYLSADHFQQIFTAHGNIMVFFVAMAFVFGLINYIVPLQIGARDLASPFLNTLGFWLYVGGVIMVNMFFALGGEYAATGWLAIAPLSGKEFSPGVGSIIGSGACRFPASGTTLGAINFIMTILKMRAPGMTLWKMPAFTWGSLVQHDHGRNRVPAADGHAFLVVFRPVSGHAFLHHHLWRRPMMYTNLIWMWGHPEVYILVLPAFGVFSEVVATFSRKPIASYGSAGAGHDRGVGVRAVGVAAPLLYHGRRRGRERVLRRHDHDYRHTNGRAGVWLDRHDVQRPHPVYGADAVVPRVYRHFHHRRPDGRDAGRAAGRLPAPQQPVPGGAFPLQCDWRRAVWYICRHQLLVPEDRRF